MQKNCSLDKILSYSFRNNPQIQIRENEKLKFYNFRLKNAKAEKKMIGYPTLQREPKKRFVQTERVF